MSRSSTRSASLQFEEVKGRLTQLGIESLPYTPSPSVASFEEVSSTAHTALDLDPEYNPYVTIESVAATGFIDKVTTETRLAARKADVDYCREHFNGRVVKTTLEESLKKLGGEAMTLRFLELQEIASNNLKGKNREIRAIQKCLEAESATPFKLDDVLVKGAYWLKVLSAYATDLAAPRSDITFYPGPTTYLPHNHFYKKKRKFDAVLRHPASDSTINNILVNIEYTTIKPPSFRYNPLVGGTASSGKLQQCIRNSDDVLSSQPTRLAAPSLSFHGRGSRAKIAFSVLTPERLELAVLENVWEDESKEGESRNVGIPSSLPKLAALLELLRTSPLHQLGFNPLVEYSVTCTNHGYQKGDIVPTSISIPPTESTSTAPAFSSTDSATASASSSAGFARVEILPPKLSPDRTHPFGRSTIVYPGSYSGESVVIKLAFVANKRSWKERVVMDQMTPPPTYVTPLLASFGFCSPNTVPQSVLQPYTLSPPFPVPFHPYVPRHLEILIFKAASGAVRLQDVTEAETFLQASKDLLLSIVETFRYGIVHRDLSTGNVLVAGSALQVIDWELGRLHEEPLTNQAGTVTGTLDTMSVYALRLPKTPQASQRKALPHDDLESAIYVIFKSLSHRFKAGPSFQATWLDNRGDLLWNTATNPVNVARCRAEMWNRTHRPGSTMHNTLLAFGEEHPQQASLIKRLFSLPLPFDYSTINDTDDHEVILASVNDLVTQAVQILEDTDPKGLCW